MPNRKPKACQSCPGSGPQSGLLYAKTLGFVPTDCSMTEEIPSQIEPATSPGKMELRAKKMAIVCEAPGKTEALTSIPLSGTTGQQFEERILTPLGLTWSDVIRDNLIRCQPAGNIFPQDEKARVMIEKCRMWNTVLDLYDPDVIILAFHPTFALIYTNQAYSTFNAIKKALHLHDKGYRPLVAMGEKFMRAYLANLPGSMADWDGKHFFIHWPKFGFSSRTYQDALKNRQDFRKVKIRLGGRK